MTRYFFHLAAGEVVLPDSKGRECSCLEDAFFHARRIAHESSPYLNDEDGQWMIRVRTPDNPLKLDVLIPRKMAAASDQSW